MLICADREQDDDYAKRPIDKIWRFGQFRECEVFIAGSGTTASIKDACLEIQNGLQAAVDSGASLLTEHRSIAERALAAVHVRYKKDIKGWPLGMLIIVAPRGSGAPPILYRTDRHFLLPEACYASHGSGKTISDYLADRLYQHGLPNESLITLATFIFREAEKSSPGVGLGNDMVLIAPGAAHLAFLGTDSIKEIEAGIPSLKDAVFSHWPTNVRSPSWLKKDYAADLEPSK